MFCPQPPKTAMLIYNKSEPKIKTQVTPAAECQCPADPTNSIVFFNPVDQTPTTGDKAGASPINLQCDKPEQFCICDESDVCWRLENAKAQVVINSFCDPGTPVTRWNSLVFHIFRMPYVRPAEQHCSVHANFGSQQWEEAYSE